MKTTEEEKRGMNIDELTLVRVDDLVTVINSLMPQMHIETALTNYDMEAIINCLEQVVIATAKAQLRHTKMELAGE